MKYSIDGNQVMCTNYTFKSLATCSAGFGDSLELAFLDLLKTSPLREGEAKGLLSYEQVWYMKIKKVGGK